MRYFVSYSYTLPNGFGFGNTEAICDRPLMGMTDVRMLQTQIVAELTAQDPNRVGSQVVVLGWQEW